MRPRPGSTAILAIQIPNRQTRYPAVLKTQPRVREIAPGMPGMPQPQAPLGPFLSRHRHMEQKTKNPNHAR